VGVEIVPAHEGGRTGREKRGVPTGKTHGALSAVGWRSEPTKRSSDPGGRDLFLSYDECGMAKKEKEEKKGSQGSADGGREARWFGNQARVPLNPGSGREGRQSKGEEERKSCGSLSRLHTQAVQ